ncbi:hypothetical protein HYC85_017023 [Camellia sinensis]|uniref:Uncharacterized protein n=1 Tax=Camellia sinensis TaxID=4442 RepID=A0A7J7H2K5_CAMSI|nr:hypothetical protein HYC85_017023 [Camellia sinensis]
MNTNNDDMDMEMELPEGNPVHKVGEEKEIGNDRLKKKHIKEGESWDTPTKGDQVEDDDSVFPHLADGYSNPVEIGVSSIDLSDDKDTKSNEEDDDERMREVTDSAIRRAFREDKSRRNAPLTAETATKVMEGLKVDPKACKDEHKYKTARGEPWLQSAKQTSFFAQATLGGPLEQWWVARALELGRTCGCSVLT